jgi:dihydrofolate synthase/folylpolyglutamate synthase
LTSSIGLPDTLEGWLGYVEGLHHRPVDLGLERVRRVAGRLDLGLEAIKIVVGGTNGKGSTCALLDAILVAAGYRVGRYGSPHLLRFNERALIQGEPASDAQLVPHFAAVERARGDTTLTYFEFTTLAILSWFAASRLDVAVLEVGLGGRLDAVNIVDADCAIVTTVDLDHMELLGPTREHIGREKAPIFRAGRPAICVDPDPPASLVDHALAIGADLWRLGRDFTVQVPADARAPRQWTYRGRQLQRASLAWPALRGLHQLRNAAGVLAALESLADRLPVDQQAVRRGLASVHLPGRFQVVPGRPAIILDVAHNPHAAQALAEALRQQAPGPGRSAATAGGPAAAPAPSTHAVFGMLRDKDAAGVVAALAGEIDRWHLAGTGGARGLAAAALAERSFAPPAPPPASLHEGVGEALACALESAGPDDRIVVFGSFVIVADALRWLERRSR